MSCSSNAQTQKNVLQPSQKKSRRISKVLHFQRFVFCFPRSKKRKKNKKLLGFLPAEHLSGQLSEQTDGPLNSLGDIYYDLGTTSS